MASHADGSNLNDIANLVVVFDWLSVSAHSQGDSTTFDACGDVQKLQKSPPLECDGSLPVSCV